MIGGVPGSDSDRELDIGLTSRWRRDHNFVAIGRPLSPGLAENSRYSFLQMDQWTAEAGRSLRDQL
jgi:hypothetical protein